MNEQTRSGKTKVEAYYINKGHCKTDEERIDHFFKSAKEMLANIPEPTEVCVFILDTGGNLNALAAGVIRTP